MTPFKVNANLIDIRQPYPPAEDIARACGDGGEQVRQAIARLWLSEGIPFAFRDKPALYEDIRFWLASRLGIDPKEITVIGSARLGQSLDPKTLGAPFSEKSDLDITTVSSSLFNRLVSDFNAWAGDYESEREIPRNSREKAFWEDNLKRGPTIIGRGFMDSKMIPRHNPYPNVRNVADAMFLLCEKLNVTPGGPRVRGADVRAYRNWEAYARQMSLNLGSLGK